MSRYQQLGGYGHGHNGDDAQNPYSQPNLPPQHQQQQQQQGYYQDHSPSPSPAPHAPSPFQRLPPQPTPPFQGRPIPPPVSPFHDHPASPTSPHQMDPRSHFMPSSPAGMDQSHMHGYQMEPMPHNRPPPGQPLEIPMGPGPQGGPSDQLAMQPTWEIQNHPNSYGHHEAYNAAHPDDDPQHSAYEHSSGDIALHPDEHHDAYYTDPYEPHPSEDPANPYGHEQQYDPSQTDLYHDEADTRPILQAGDSSFGPDPNTAPSPIDERVQSPLPARQTTLKRWKTVKEVQLFEGNLILDCPVPPRLLNQVEHVPPPGRDEYTHMRYSAVTGDPSEFHQRRFRLRQQLFAKPRHTELFICVTMYNEEDELFARTMVGIIKNIEYMNSRTSSKTWGKEAWKKIVVCVVSDGRAKINPRTRAVLAALGCYQEGIAKQEVNKDPVTAHVYEYTTQMSLDIKKNVVNVKKGTTPIQMIFCLKEKNQKKINSHRWFFQAFGSVLNPNICVLIDAGTRPGKDSIYQLWKAFDIEPQCAGACGEIKAMLEYGKQLLNPLVAAQNFEYKISNILDKPVESVFGFISVLPGAFSAYRYVALQNDKSGQGPLEKYFAGEKMHGANAGIFTANMYLAEDRILCFELVAKRNCRWILQYVKSAEGATDVPTEMADFILQRRRWLNGSFFAAVYATAHFYQIFRSSHSCIRKCAFMFEFVYQLFNQIFAWFAIGNFFLVFKILTTSLGDPTLLGTAGRVLAAVFEWLYLVTLISCFVLALGNRPQGSNRLYMTMVWFWVVLMIYLMFAAIFVVVKSIQNTIASNGGKFTVQLLFTNRTFATLIISLLATYVLYFTMSILFLDPWHMFTSFIQYMLLTPSYINILNVYAFCNTHDITWGTKGDTKPEALPSVKIGKDGAVNVALPDSETDLNTQYEAELRQFATKFVVEKKKPSDADKQEDYYKGFRSAVVLVWIFCNLALCGAVLSVGGFDKFQQPANNSRPSRRQAPANPQQGGSSSNSGASASSRDDIITNNSLIYMQVILGSVAALSAVRWIGSLWFLVLRLLRGV